MPGLKLSRIALIALTLLSGACSDPEPIRLGFIGGLSGANADLGLAARNGAQLAVEQHNAAAINYGRSVQLIIRDDELNPEQGKKALAELLEQRVDAVIGPMTSTVAMALAPMATEAGVLLMGGPVSTDLLNGRDDQFFRTIGSNDEHARVMATFLNQRHDIKRVSLIVDHRNKAYTDTWAGHFSTRLNALGGRDKVKFIALLVQGIPRSLKVDGHLARASDPLAPLELDAVQLGEAVVKIPDLIGLEQKLADAGLI